VILTMHACLLQVADRIGYSRATVAGAETNRRRPGQAFWTRADDLLAPHGELRAAYAQLAAARRDLARRHARQAEDERDARIARRRAGQRRGPLALAGPAVSGTADPWSGWASVAAAGEAGWMVPRAGGVLDGLTGAAVAPSGGAPPPLPLTTWLVLPDRPSGRRGH
jgi:hypothetical protein